MEDKILLVDLEILKSGIYKDTEISDSDIQEIYENAVQFPVVNGHEKLQERRFEATKNKGIIVGLKDGIIIAKITLDLSSELGKQYLNGSLFNWSVVINNVDGKLVITELGLLGNVPPAVKGLKELSRVSFSEIDIEIEVETENKTQEVYSMEELKAMIDALIARVDELEKPKEVEEVEVPVVELGELDILKADKEKLMGEVQTLKDKLKEFETAKFSEIIEVYANKDEVKKSKLIELSAKFESDFKGFEEIVKSISIVPEQEVLIVQPKKVVSNLELSAKVGNKKVSLKNM